MAEADRPLRVLLISLHHPELVRGGAQQVCYELFRDLKTRNDVEPILLASADESMPGLFKPGARITGFDGQPDEYLFLSRDYDYWWHKVGDPLLIETFVEFLLTIRPDVVHFHHFLTFGIDLISVVRRTLPSVRIVFTFHEFLAICVANGHMVRTTDQSLCDRASQVRCHQCFPDRGPEQFLIRKMWFQRHLDNVDQFTVPSAFMIETYADWGIPRDKICHVTNAQAGIPLPPVVQDAAEPRNRFGFFGQLVDVKGVQIILRAIELLRLDGFTDFVVEINGDNRRYASPPIRAEIEAALAAEAERPHAERRLVFNGSYHHDQLAARMARIDWCIVPSIWGEVFGLVVSEAWRFGKPVICSKAGALAERVIDNESGLHFEMGDARSLAAVMRRACTERGLWSRLRQTLPVPPPIAEMTEGYLKAYRPAGGMPTPAAKEDPVTPLHVVAGGGRRA